MEKFLTVEEAAQMLSCSVATIRKKLDDRELTKYKRLNRIYVLSEEVKPLNVPQPVEN
jgi:excisionase family DNA binding protein